ncbi:MAG: hypothetical protein GY791_04230 [Alphaproteobacteria bacterium]|nr:hypothetical protein [Alphaproteobacteria bacterium]
MKHASRPDFSGGPNVAMKVPGHEYEAVVGFYRDTLGLTVVEERTGVLTAFAFGPMILWIDRVEGVSQAELWLEINTGDTAGAAAYLKGAGVTRCDAIEPLPAGLDGFWIMNPANMVHLVARDGRDEEEE